MNDSVKSHDPGLEEERQGPRLTRRVRQQSMVALALILPAQSLGVAAMLLALPGVVGIGINALSRLWMLVFPYAWTRRVERRRPVIARPTRLGMIAGLVTGGVIFFVMLGIYWLVSDQIDLERLRSRAETTGFDHPIRFSAMLGFIIVLNSLLEEYVWRWFVFRHVEMVLPERFSRESRQAASVVIAALLFTVHHVVALVAWVDGWLVVLGSIGVFLGAVIWSALYAYDRSLWPSYVSHLLADVAILVIGYDVLFRNSA